MIYCFWNNIDDSKIIFYQNPLEPFLGKVCSPVLKVKSPIYARILTAPVYSNQVTYMLISR